ncbi:hypothetical protein SAMN05216312_12219 [Cohnella sp. OV330]|uniref:hypothetical protein n=1 Tax=Cohnella sp. OV330 TaxID=1855288 RepID=UPI0008E2EA94|nr:hypothetical protein [Cohnella sp. OV330]SFB62570.1 hypothetical protein SAMN05216312_12219 [Cohnella sp. OV330]
MIQVFFSINNNQEVLQLPVPPKEFTVPKPWKNDQIDGLQQSLNRIGIRGLRSIEISSFFPIREHDYPFLQSRDKWGMEYVQTIERWREKRIPIRLVIVDSNGQQNVNMAVSIDEFEHGMKEDGDIQFSLRMTEFPLILLSRR